MLPYCSQSLAATPLLWIQHRCPPELLSFSHPSLTPHSMPRRAVVVVLTGRRSTLCRCDLRQVHRWFRPGTHQGAPDVWLCHHLSLSIAHLALLPASPLNNITRAGAHADTKCGTAPPCEQRITDLLPRCPSPTGCTLLLLLSSLCRFEESPALRQPTESTTG